MKRLLIISLALLAVNLGQAQGVEQLLASIEQNNVALKAQRELTNAQTLGARVGNSLADPTVSLDHLWGGAPGQSEKRGEMKVVQEFDFPTAYINRNALARERAAQYGHEYSIARQQILLQAKQAYISLTHLNQLRAIELKRLSQVEQVAANYDKRLASGDANILEKKRADIELITMRRACEQTEIEISAIRTKLQGLNGGQPLEPNLGVADNYLPQAVQPLDEMVKLYEESDPQMLLLNSEIAVAERDVKVSRNVSLPKFELGYRYDFAPSEKFNGVVVGLSVPMFGNRNNVKRAKAQEQYARTQMQSNRLDLRTTLEELYNRRQMLHDNINNFRITQDNHAELLSKALDAGQMSITDYYTEMNVYYSLYEQLIEMTRDYNLVCAQIDAVRL